MFRIITTERLEALEADVLALHVLREDMEISERMHIKVRADLREALAASRERVLCLESLAFAQQRLIGRLRSAIGRADSALKDEGDAIDRAREVLDLKPNAQVEIPLHHTRSKANPAVMVPSLPSRP